MKKWKKKNRPSAGTEDRKDFTVDISAKISNDSHQALALKETIIKTVFDATSSVKSHVLKSFLESVH